MNNTEEVDIESGESITINDVLLALLPLSIFALIMISFCVSKIALIITGGFWVLMVIVAAIILKIVIK